LFATTYNIAISIARLARMRGPKRKAAIAAAYARIRCTELILRFTGSSKTSETFLGFKFEFFDYQTFAYLFEEIFVQQVYYFETKRNQPVIYDCGANVGLSILYFKMLYPEARITAFEPDQNVLPTLQRNIEQNRLQEIKIEGVALAAHEGSLISVEDQSTTGNPSKQFQRAERQDSVKGARIEARTLSSYLKTPIDVLKMDIEGFEWEVINEVASSGKIRLIGSILMECHHNRIEGVRTGEGLNVLERAGYRYQMSAPFQTPFSTLKAQDLMIHAKREAVLSSP
jgi:FkbM family methyltransferase